MLSIGSARAATYSWTPTDGGFYNWDNSGGQKNWGTGFPNLPGDVAKLVSSGLADMSIDLNVPVTVGVLEFNAPVAFVLQQGIAGSLVMNNGAAGPAQINQLASGFTLNTILADVRTVGDLNISSEVGTGPLLFSSLGSSAKSGTQKVTLLSGTARFDGAVTDGSTGGQLALEAAGTSTLSLFGDNTFTGGITLGTGATLNIGSPTALGAGRLVINGGTLSNNGFTPVANTNVNAQTWAGDFSFAGPLEVNLGTGAVTLTGNRTITSTAGNLAVGGVIDDGGANFGITKLGTGSLTLAGANKFGGPVLVNAGALVVQNAGALGKNTAVTVTTGGTLTLDGGVAVSGKTLSIAGEGQGQGGALRSTGDNSWTGDIAADTSAIVRVVSASGTLTLNGNVVTNGTNANGLVLQGTGIINGVISGSGALTRSNNDPGTWTFNGANTYFGATLISNGAIKLGNANAIQNSAVTLNSTVQNGLQFAPGIGTFNLVSLAGTSTSRFALNDSDGGPVNLAIGSANTSTTYPGAISGTGTVSKVGTGTFTLSGASTFSGGVLLNAGTLVASDATANLAQGVLNARSALGTGTVTLAAGTTLALRANGNNDSTQQLFLFPNPVALSGPATINVDRQGANGGNSKILGLGTLYLGSDVLTVTGGNSFQAQFSAINLVANGTLSTGTNVFVGDIGQKNGTPTFTKNGTGKLTVLGTAAPAGGFIVPAATGTVQFGNNGFTGTLSGNLANDSAVVFSRFDNTTYGGVISGTGSFTKLGSGTLTLSGANTFAGATSVGAGTLVLDHTLNPVVINPASIPNVTGSLVIKAAPTGTTNVTLGNLTVPSSVLANIVLDPNGGAGLTLTLGNSWVIAGSDAIHFDLSRGGSVVSGPSVANGLIVSGVVARTTVTGTDGRTYFANRDGSNFLVPQTALTDLPASGGSATVNYRVAGNLVTTGAVSTATLRLDTTGGAGSLDLGGSLTFGNTAILMDGAGDFEIKRTTGTGTIANTVIHQYGTGTLFYNAPIAAGGGFTKAGPGLLVAGMSTGAAGSVTLTEGVLRIGATTATPTGTINISGGALLELGAADWTGSIGTGAGQVRIIGDGGFSAYGANRLVNIGGAGAAVFWETVNFLPNNSTFILGSPKANAMVDFVNPLALGGFLRTLKVNDGSAPIDAQLSGAIGGSIGLVKTGPGTLALAGTSPNFSGVLSVREGGLIVNGSVAGSVTVASGTLQGSGDGLVSGLIGGAVTVGDGAGTGDAVLSPGSNGVGALSTNGPLSLASDAEFRFEFDSSTRLADQMGALGMSIAPGVMFRGFDVAAAPVALPLGTQFIVLNNNSFDAPIQGTFANLPEGGTIAVGGSFLQASYTGGSGNDLVFTVIPEPGSLGCLLAGSVALLGVGRRRRKG